MTKKALITGQDGAYLAELMRGKGYKVQGIKHCTSMFKTDRINEIAWRRGWITLPQFENISKALGKSSYGQYLHALLTGTVISCSEC